MTRMRSMDPNFPIERQFAVDASPIVLVNLITMGKADEQAFLDIWGREAIAMKQKPGFISTQLHRAIGDSPTYLNYAVWESTAHFRAARQNSAAPDASIAIPSSVVSAPHLFQKVALAGVCVA
ncbi:antibiotic biosynthesis monooxygenase family protein [Mesorhizobium sp. MSK_1335]|uniref:Antibiotic biosynthesis monooxygenase family protein n=1 Tax=Mesorhizobium montanum TaxID=3072323 RepID=A0ABU4ZJ75_9HYPH|nr:antibiotic biosynthesis monooxygenase family protein [Mesorhizobium sp. MSK_1335]MDX8525395.1 antibiotic biosynthesis monooxygenase family protein [Mesorhizobium sp. MSK_1335]